MPENPLGRKAPTDWVHVERYPLTATTTPALPVPSSIGINWYPEFDRPQKSADGRWRVGTPRIGSTPRGGHCVCVLPVGLRDHASWWKFYDQGAEGACVGFGESRAMSLLNRHRYDARWLYKQAQLGDEWPDTPPGEGTSVRAGLDVLRTVGHIRIYGRWSSGEPKASEGIAANRWAMSVDDWLTAIGRPGAGEVPFLNSWGKSYPHIVWMPTSVIERLMREDGEFPIITDR